MHLCVTHSKRYLWGQRPVLARSLDRVYALGGRVKQRSLGFPFFDTDRGFGRSRGECLGLDTSWWDTGRGHLQGSERAGLVAWRRMPGVD